jgi:hypothetical protein
MASKPSQPPGLIAQNYVSYSGKEVAKSAMSPITSPGSQLAQKTIFSSENVKLGKNPEPRYPEATQSYVS